MLKKVEDYQEWIIDSFLLINLIGITVLSSLYHLMQLKLKKMLQKKIKHIYDYQRQMWNIIIPHRHGCCSWGFDRGDRWCKEIGCWMFSRYPFDCDITAVCLSWDCLVWIAHYFCLRVEYLACPLQLLFVSRWVSWKS